MQSTRLAAEAYEKEQRRIRGLRERHDHRRDRYLNARLRTIGIDAEGIEAQLSEKEANAGAAQKAEDAYNTEAMRIRYLLEQQATDEARLRAADAAALQRDHWNQMALPKNQMPRAAGMPDDADACGISAAQCFLGEDRDRAARLAGDRAAMKRWCDEQAARHAQDKEDEDAEKQRYHDYLMAVTKAREDQEDALRRAMYENTRDTANRNAEEARLRALRNRLQAEADDAAAQAEIRLQTDSAFLTEDMGQGFNNATGRLVPDRYKGLTDAERRACILDNERVLAEKRARERKEADDERAYAADQDRIHGMLTELAAERALMEQRAALKQKEDHLRQQQEALEKRRRDREAKFGSVDNAVGFYSGFGQSCR